MNHTLSDTIQRKFVDTIDLSSEGWEILTPTGYVDVSTLYKTVQYSVWHLEFDDGSFLDCADNHILITENEEEIFAKNSLGVGILNEQDEVSIVTFVEKLPMKEHMYDLEIDSENHVYYTNGVLSHNTITTVSYLLWYSLFQADKMIAIVANKGDTAREILSRYTFALENVPFFLQPGCKTLNKGSIEFSNNTRIVARASSANSLRSLSCVTGDTKICIEDDNENIFYTEIDDFINKSKLPKVKEMVYLVYKITNTINNKIYVGFHKTNNIDDGYMGSGKLIKKAIEKYGIEAFKKEIIEVFDNKEDAEALEASIVDKNFTLREDTYNIAIGGNVRIMYGKNSPMYGKKHTEETKQRISKKRKQERFYSHKIYAFGKKYDDIIELEKYLNTEEKERINILDMCGNASIKDMYFLDPVIQIDAEKFYIERKNSSANASKRFSNVPKTEDHRLKISNALKGIKRENPQNKDPEKIRKMAEKHRGMKRSEEAKKKMSLAKKGRIAKNKGKKYFRNPDSEEGNYFIEGTQPIGWIQGTGSRKAK